MLMFRTDRPIAWVSSSLVFYRVPRCGSFALVKEFVIAWTHIGWVRQIFQNLPFPAAQAFRDSSSGVTPFIVKKNYGVLYYQALLFSPESMWFHLFTKVKEPLWEARYSTRDEPIRAIGRPILNINKDGPADGAWRFPNIWQKVVNKRTPALKVHKSCTPVNKAMSEISNNCHFFLFNLCMTKKIRILSFEKTTRLIKTRRYLKYKYSKSITTNRLQQNMQT